MHPLLKFLDKYSSEGYVSVFYPYTKENSSYELDELGIEKHLKDRLSVWSDITLKEELKFVKTGDRLNACKYLKMLESREKYRNAVINSFIEEVIMIKSMKE